jgi:predicted DNA-binding transcriptional regulator AlpA
MTASRPRKQPGKAKPPARAKTTSSRPDDEFLTLAEFCTKLKISRSTFYDWRAKRKAPRCIPLPNGSLRISRDEFDRWLNAREDTV